MSKEKLSVELECYVQGGLVKHPLLMTPVSPNADCAHINQVYASKKTQANQAIRGKDWSEYIWLYEKPFRAAALSRCVKAGLGGDEYWSLLAKVWIGTENAFQNRRLWRRLWNLEQPGRRSCMTRSEQRLFDRLPDQNVVWRGTGHPREKYPLAWTFDKEIAALFARHRSNERYLVRGIVEREDIIAVMLRRRERELICKSVKIAEVRLLAEGVD